MSNLFQQIIARLTYFIISIPWLGPKFAKWHDIEFDEFKDEYRVPWHERFKESAVMLLAPVPLLGAWIVSRFCDPERVMETKEKMEERISWRDRWNRFCHSLPFIRNSDAEGFESEEGEGLSVGDHWNIFWQTLPFNTAKDEYHFKEYDQSMVEHLTVWQRAKNLSSYIMGKFNRQLSSFAKPDNAFSDNQIQNYGASWILYCLPVLAVMVVVGAALVGTTFATGNDSPDDAASPQLGKTEQLLLRFQEITEQDTLSTYGRLESLGEKISIAKQVMDDEEFSSKGIEMLLDSNLETAIVCISISAQVPDRIRVVLEDEKYSINSRCEKLLAFSQLVLQIVDWSRFDKENWLDIEESLVELLQSTKFEEQDRVKWAFLRFHSGKSDYFPKPNDFKALILEHLVISD